MIPLKIGLECHSRLRCTHKLFSGALNYTLLPDGRPNEHVSRLDLGIPGQLPVLNLQAVHLALRACLFLKCNVQDSALFDRKHYLYHDLPVGYQITQHRYPIGFNGVYESIPIARVQLETDTAKLLEEQESGCLMDFNRSGVALIEIVTEPQFSSIDSVVSFVSKLNEQLTNLAVIDRNIEDGSFRVDANLNIQHNGANLPKVEIKNVMGFRFLRQALQFEYDRQVSLLRNGGDIIPETRMFCQKSGHTFSIRDVACKNYYFIPEHEIPPLQISQAMMNAATLDNQYLSSILDDKIPENLLFQLKNSVNAMELFVNILEQNPAMDKIHCINWICNDVLKICNRKMNHLEQRRFFSNANVARQLKIVINYVAQQRLSKASGLHLLECLIDDQTEDVSVLADAQDLWLVKDVESINRSIQDFVKQFPLKSCADFIKHHKGKYCPQTVVKQFPRRPKNATSSSGRCDFQ